MTASLYLVLPHLPAQPARKLANLTAALGAEAALLPAESAHELVSALQADGVAVVVETHVAAVEALGADGLHLSGDGKALKAARAALDDDIMLGTTAPESRHAALELGEAGADYVAFGGPGAPAGPPALEIVAWWRDMVALPCVVFAGRDLTFAAAAAKAGADFVALEMEVEGNRLLPPGTARDIAAALAGPT